MTSLLSPKHRDSEIEGCSIAVKPCSLSIVTGFKTDVQQPGFLLISNITVKIMKASSSQDKRNSLVLCNRREISTRVSESINLVDPSLVHLVIIDIYILYLENKISWRKILITYISKARADERKLHLYLKSASRNQELTATFPFATISL